MAAEQREAEAIRLQLVELSEHILRRLAIVLSRARAHSRHAYDQVEATARDITNVQREMMEELARPVARREELAMLTALMRVQDRSMTVLEQLERLPFNEPAARLKPISSATAEPRGFLAMPEIAPWPDDPDGRPDAFPSYPVASPPTVFEPPRPEPPSVRSRGSATRPPPLAPTGRLQTQSSVGQQLPTGAGQAPVRSARSVPPRQPTPEPARPTRSQAPARPQASRPDVPPEVVDVKAVALAEMPAKARPVISFGERVQRAAGRLWYVVVRIPQVVLTVTFVAVGLVLLVMLGRMFFVVADGLNTKRGDPQAIEKSEERLPADDKPGSGGPLVSPPGDGFVVVLSMHPDAATARKTYSEMLQRMPTVLANLTADIQPMETQNGLRYRLALSPALPRERAFALCAELKNNGFPACWLRRLQR